jgi:hypothetical protein
MSVLDNTPDTEEATTRIVALEDGRELALVPAANDGAEGALVFFEVSDGIVALITISAHPGEFEALEEAALAVISSLNFSGTAEELLEAIDPVPPADFVFG